MDSLAVSEWFVLTKLHPPLVRNHTIRRLSLEKTLSHSVSTNPLTLLSAPAGYGKTTLLASLPTLLPNFRLAWITLDAEDNDPVRFIGLLACALKQLNPQCGRSIWSRTSGGIDSGSDIKKAVTALINDIVNYIRGPFVLVLDDLHSVTEPLVHTALDYLLELCPPNLHVAIGTRDNPPLRLNRLAVRGQLGELRQRDLSMDEEQANQLLNGILQLNLSPAEISILNERTEGWPGALCLLAGPLGRMDSSEERLRFLATMHHSERQVFEFVTEEIFLEVPEHIQAFLLKTSILSEISPSVANAVTDREDSDAILSELYRRNLAIAAISMDQGGEPVYRYHALFARMLQEQLVRQNAVGVSELHRKAAEVQKIPGRAIFHYLAAGLWDRAVELIVRYGMEMLHKGMAETIRQWYHGLPQDVRGSYSRLTTLMARCDIHRGDYESAGRLLRKSMDTLTSEDEEADALASLITLAYDRSDRGMVASYVERAFNLPLNPVAAVAVRLANAWLQMHDCNWEAVATSVEEALAIPASTSDRRADLIGITYTSAPMATVPGCMQVVEAYCSEVSQYAPPDTAWYLGAQELGTWPMLWRGEVDDALKRAEGAEALRQKLGGYPFVGNDLPVLLCILYLAKGDSEAAMKAVNLLDQRLALVGRNNVMLHLHAAGRTFALLGEYERAFTMLRRLDSLADCYKLTEYLAQHLRGLLAILNRQHDLAILALKGAVGLEDQLLTAHVGGSARLLWASLLLEEGKPEAALTMADPVLQRWSRLSLPGYALIDGHVTVPVLRLASEASVVGSRSILRLFGQEISVQRKSANTNRQPSNSLSELLSPREHEVLRLLMMGFTNRQISAELYISAETVKSHVSSVFRKLGVESRTQAALRAQELSF